ncbi:MAG: helix-turn-helix domain-containing protein [Treponema sp.]|jgi:excisionase family DNA binding protein|nr:helix-turn-helix domain-containing protein [Treponema sp.]
MKGSEAVPVQEKPVRGKLLTPKEVADEIRMGVKTVYVMAENGELPSHRVRCSLRFDSADVADYLFLSKFHSSNLKLSSVDKDQVLARIDDQLAHTRRYAEMLLKQGRRQ